MRDLDHAAHRHGDDRHVLGGAMMREEMSAAYRLDIGRDGNSIEMRGLAGPSSRDAGPTLTDTLRELATTLAWIIVAMSIILSAVSLFS